MEASNIRMHHLTGRSLKTNSDEKQKVKSDAVKAVEVNVDNMFTDEPVVTVPRSNSAISTLQESSSWSQGAPRILDKVSIPSLATIQAASLACIDAMHSFSLYQAVNLPSSVPNSILWDVEFAANIVETALKIWALCIQQAPDVINYLFGDASGNDKPMFRFLSNIFSIDRVSFGSQEIPDSLVRGANMFGIWFVGAMSDLLRMIKSFSISHLHRILDQLVAICFRLRPKLTNLNIATSIDFHQLTLLTSLLREFRGAAVSDQLLGQCHEAGIEISNELVVFYSRVHFAKTPVVSEKLIAGTLVLLCEAARCGSTLIPALAEEGLENLLVGGCLGLSSVEDLMQPVVCDGDESRFVSFIS
jgi:hypothetical protein